MWGQVCEKCGKRHRGYTELRYRECAECCAEVGILNLNYPGSLCDKCYEARQNKTNDERKTDARPNLVVVGSYTYRSNIPDLEVGDVVLLPASWVDEMKGRGPQEGVVTCLFSDYDGPVKSILKLVRKGKKTT